MIELVEREQSQYQSIFILLYRIYTKLMSKKEVLVVTHPLAPASESHVSSLLEILSATTSVALVTTNLPDESSIRNKYDVQEISKAGMYQSIIAAAVQFVLNQFRMCRVITARNEDIVLFFGATSYLLPIFWARLTGRTVVLEPRGDVPLTLRLQWEQRVPSLIARTLAGIVRLLERIGYYLAHGIITYTPSMAEQLGLDAYAQKLYPNGARYVDIDEFCPSVPFEKRDRVVGFLGRLDEEKGVRELAEVAKHLPEEVVFRFIGDGELREWLESELDAELDRESVEVTGWVEHGAVPEQLSALRLLVLPSHPTEGLPTVVLESLACGTPVYATPVSGVPDVVKEGETGFLMNETDPTKIAERITDIQQRDDLDTVSENGRHVIEQEYSFEAAVNRYRQILQSL